MEVKSERCDHHFDTNSFNCGNQHSLSPKDALNHSRLVILKR